VRALEAALLRALLAFVLSGCALVDGPDVAVPTPQTVIPQTLTPEPATPGVATCEETDYALKADAGKPVDAGALSATRTIIENRLDALGTVTYAVRTQAPDRLTVTFRSSASHADVRDLIGATGALAFVPIPEAFSDRVVDDQPLPDAMPVSPLFDGGQVAVARIGSTPTGLPAVDIGLAPDGAKALDTFASAHLGERFAIVLDGVALSTPTINAPRFDGRVQISGNFTPEDARLLVIMLVFSELPTPIHEVGSSARSCADVGL
jgi:preprotein translocase subunit SecD